MTGVLETEFWFAPGAVLLYWGEETHPRLYSAHQMVSEMGDKEAVF
jgi:hypothetical protein